MLKINLLLGLPLFYLLGIVPLFSCGEKKGEKMAKAEEVYMMARYKDKMDRPSPPARSETNIGMAKVSIDYSQPSVRGRKIWGGLEKYNKIWRTGANEANVLETTHPLLINGDTVPAGKFGFFTIPAPNDWTVIINKGHDQWGIYNYKESEDVLRLKVKPYKTNDITEKMTFRIDSTGKLSFAWEYLKFDLQIEPLPLNNLRGN
jgi:hypothetical protein